MDDAGTSIGLYEIIALVPVVLMLCHRADLWMRNRPMLWRQSRLSRSTATSGNAPGASFPADTVRTFW